VDLERLAFSYEICKIAKERSRKSYGAQMLAAAPVAAATAASDFPKGWVDRKVETAVARGIKPALREKAWKVGVGRAAGRLGGGLVTTPLFFSGIKDLKEGRKWEGTAKVLAAGGGYSAIKGGIEAVVKNRGKKMTKKKVLNLAGKIGGTRGVIGLGSAALTAASIAKAQKKSKSKSWKDRVLVPAVIGAGIGAPKGAIENVVETGVKKTVKGLRGPGRIKALRRIGGAAAGRSASGVIGAVAISEAARLLSGKTKKAEVSNGITSTPSAGELYANTRFSARKASDQVLQDFLKQRSDPERTPTRRAMTYAVNDELRSRGVSVPKEKMRDQTHPPMVKGTTLANTASVAAVIVAPSLVWELGISRMEAGQKDLALRDALDQMAVDRGIERIHAGTRGGEIDFDARPEAYYRSIGGETVRSEAQKIDKRHRDASPRARAAARRLSEKIRSGQKHIISTPKNAPPSSLAHELGHATAGRLRRKTIASRASQMSWEISKIPAVALPLVVLDSASDKSFHTKEEIEAKAKFSERVGMVSLLLGAPELAEEATASIKGLQYMRRAGASNKQLVRAAAKLIPAWSTYAAPFATGALVAKVLRSRPERKSDPRSDHDRMSS
tara:strand:- start:567 stop:2408 length:1842 start_codon:yes stop_codon:yes gene_type:complete